MDEFDVDEWIDNQLENRARLDRPRCYARGSCTNPDHNYSSWHGIARSGLNGKVCPGSHCFKGDGTLHDWVTEADLAKRPPVEREFGE